MKAVVQRGFLANRWRLLVAAMACSAGLTVLVATPAVAENDHSTLLELSRDGVTYVPSRLHQVFESAPGFVPGESRQGRVWVRNASREDAYLSLAVVNTDSTHSEELPEHLSLQAATPQRSAIALSLPGSGECSQVIQKWTLKSGEAIPLTLDLSLDVQAPNSSKKQAATFNLMFVLQGIGGGRTASACSAVSTTDTVEAVSDRSIGVAPLGGAAPLDLQDAQRVDEWSEAELLHSNVVANSRSPWPWLVTLSGAAYMLISLRRRRKTQ